MKVTRFPQSCLLIEKDDYRLVIDPGSHFLQTHSLDELNEVGAVLYTHQHADHYDAAIANSLLENGAAVYANPATALLMHNPSVTVVSDGMALQIGPFEVIAHELPHCLLPDGSAGPQNTGYIIDGTLFHPGDGKVLEGVTVDNLALPITGPDISMLDAINFAKQVQATVVIPIHYQAIPFDPEVFSAYAQRGGGKYEVRILADGESTDL